MSQVMGSIRQDEQESEGGLVEITLQLLGAEPVVNAVRRREVRLDRPRVAKPTGIPPVLP